MIKAYKTYIYVLVFLLQGYFGAVGALMELLKTTEDPWRKFCQDNINS